MIQAVDAAFWRKKLADLGYEARAYCKSKKALSAFALRYAGFRIDPKNHVTITVMHDRIRNYISLQLIDTVYNQAKINVGNRS